MCEQTIRLFRNQMILASVLPSDLRRTRLHGSLRLNESYGMNPILLEREKLQHISRNSWLTTGSGSPECTELTMWTSWCAYSTNFVTRQPSSRSTRPCRDERWEETFETEAGSRWISGRSSRAGTAANGLTERRSDLVISDIWLDFKFRLCLFNKQFVNLPNCRKHLHLLSM